MNKKGQLGFSFIMSIIMIVVAIMLITAFWPTIATQFDGLRDQSNLNCVSTSDICGGIGSNSSCYNSSVGNSHTLTCGMLSISPALIFIMLILGAVGLIVGGGGRPVQQYPGY